MNESYEINLARPTCTVPETADILDIGLNAAYDAIKRGDIPSIRIGKSLRVPTAALRAMLGIPPSNSKIA
jgi:excisionase family DNA binding protein